MGKKKKKKLKKKGMLGTIADAVAHPVSTSQSLTPHGKLLGGIEIAQLVAALAALFKSDGEPEDSEKGFRERIEELVDKRVSVALDGDALEKRFEEALEQLALRQRAEIGELADRIEELEQRIAKLSAARKRRAAALQTSDVEA